VDAAYLLDVVRRLAQSVVTRRDLHRAASRSRFPKPADLDAPLGVLVDHGYLTRLPDPPASGKGGRPPSPSWQVHPAAAAVGE
jgi:replicative DNA helicase